MSEKKKDKFRRFTQEEINALPGRELKSRRTRSSKTYSLGNGLYQAVIYPDAIHYRNEQGKWEDIDHTLTQENDAFCDHSGDLGVTLAPGGCVTLKKDAHTLSWQIRGAAPAMAVPDNTSTKFPRHDKNLRTENKVTYSNIFPDVDFVCELKPNQFKDTLIFKTSEALRPVEFLIRAENLVLRQAASGAVVAMCGDDTIFCLPAPCVVDKFGDAVPSSANAVLTQISDCEWCWTCEVSAEYAANAVYPILLDPVVETQQTANVLSMAYTASKKPTTNYPGTGYSVRIANNNSTYGKCNTYLRFEYDPDNVENSALPPIDSSYYVTAAELTMRTAYNGGSTPVYIKEVQETWDATTITFDNSPKVCSEPMEYYVAPASSGKYLHFNITNLVRKWYNGDNNGLMLETLAGNTVQLGGAGATYAKPYITITYVSLAGLESYLVQDSISCGRAGTAYVGLFNGNLVFGHQETSMNGNLMPVSIGRFYNSCYKDVNAFHAGNGWKFSTQQTLHKETIDSTVHYVYMDGDGTRHFFKKTNGEWKDLSGLELTLEIDGSDVTITDKDNKKMTYPLPVNEFLVNGEENYANVTWIISNEDACGNKSEFIHTKPADATENEFSIAKDGADRSTTATVNTALMVTKLQAPDMSPVLYEYDANDQLTKITHPDGAVTEYGYNENGLLESIKNHDGTAIVISYYPIKPFRVAQITQLASNKIYAARKYVYGDCCTTVTELIPTVKTQNAAMSALTATALAEYEANLSTGEKMFAEDEDNKNIGKSLHYHFNDAGNLVSINDGLGYGCFAGYSDDVPTNHPSFVSKMQRSVNNYLKNHHFLTTTNNDWIGDLMDGEGECSYSSEMNYAGGRAYRLMKTSEAGTISVYQNVTLKKNRSYTFSCQYKTLNSAKVQLKVEWKDSTGADGSAISPAFACTDRWNRTHVSFTLPDDETAQNVTVRIIATGGAGKVWADAAQVEDGLVPNRYNLLENANFYMNDSGRPLYWSYTDDVEDTDGVTTNAAAGRPTELIGNVVSLKGAYGATKEVYQDMSCIGSKGDTFVAGGWSCSHCRPRNDNTPTVYEMEVLARPLPEDVDLDADVLPSFRTVGHVMWSEEWSGWQFAAIPVVMPWRYTAVQVRLVYQNNLNEAQFSNLFLHKEEFGKTFAYDENGNVTSVKNLAALQSGSEYDDFDNLISYHQPGRSEEYTLNWGSTDDDKRKHLLRSTTSPLNIIQRTKYDVEDSTNTAPKGLPLESSVENAAGTMKIVSKTTYSDDDNYVRQQIDARNQIVTTETHTNLGTVTSVTDPKGQKVEYEYDTLKRVTKVSTTIASENSDEEDRVFQNVYTYSGDKLMQVSHNTTDNDTCDVVYKFEYDEQNRRTKVKVGDQSLSENTYSSAPDASFGTLTQMKYGNGDTVNYKYDEFKRMTSMQYGSDVSKKFSYEYGANGQVARVTNHELNRTVLSEHDSCSRPMRITHLSGTEHLYTGEVTYDAQNNLHTFEEQVGEERTAYKTTYSYDVENKPTLLQYEDSNPTNDSTSNKVTYEYDSLGRLVKRTATVNGNAFYANYAYVDGGHGENSTTGLIKTITQTGGTFEYDYDVNDNIISVKQDGAETAYTYDALGQLIRVVDGQEGATWEYDYDQGGNIKSKKKFVGDNLAESTTFGYVHEESSLDEEQERENTWRDLLKYVNGKRIYYDEIGNPTQFGEDDDEGKVEYSWVNGRQLARIHSVDIDASFMYNENGLRVQKTVNGMVTHYILHDKNIVHMTQGNDELHFFYDANNKPSIVEYKGEKYAYVHNLQGDIVAILDSTGNMVVKYKYDAWGKPCELTGSMKDDLGKLNPFRYRGYVYDEETNLYYLRSRYYAPSLCRFVNADSVDYLDAKLSPLSCNLFTYCDNNPTTKIDVNGKAAANIVGGIIGGVAGALLGNMIADALGLSSWERWLLIAAITVAGAALGAIIGPYIAKLSTAAAEAITAGLTLASEAAYQAAQNAWDYIVKSKHLLSTGGNYQKFCTDCLSQIQTWINQALTSPNALFYNNPQKEGTFMVYTDLGFTIGSRGEHIIKIVFDALGGIITAYPVKKIP